MSENTAFALVLCAAIASCTACSISDSRLAALKSPTLKCVELARSQEERLQCLKDGKQ